MSLFAGIGGIDIGLDRAGWECCGQVEIDPWCRGILARHWPGVPRHDDATTAPAWWASQPRPRIDLVAGGFPCQPFSVAGLRHGMADDRWLWPAMADTIRVIRPRYVFVENVPGLVADAGAFGRVLGDLAALGFDAEWTVLPAWAFGAPQASRERLLLVAHPSGVDGSAWDLLGQSRDRPAPLSVGGLPGLAPHIRGRAARQWLAREPRVDRMADGIPDQVVQLHGYGNAVIPAVAAHIGRLIIDDMEAHRE